MDAMYDVLLSVMLSTQAKVTLFRLSLPKDGKGKVVCDKSVSVLMQSYTGTCEHENTPA